ncbi:hypothetical protein F4810DRAFT_718148, partial [Camillea tinctor]
HTTGSIIVISDCYHPLTLIFSYPYIFRTEVDTMTSALQSSTPSGLNGPVSQRDFWSVVGGMGTAPELTASPTQNTLRDIACAGVRHMEYERYSAQELCAARGLAMLVSINSSPSGSTSLTPQQQRRHQPSPDIQQQEQKEEQASPEPQPRPKSPQNHPLPGFQPINRVLQQRKAKRTPLTSSRPQNTQHSQAPGSSPAVPSSSSSAPKKKCSGHTNEKILAAKMRHPDTGMDNPNGPCQPCARAGKTCRVMRFREWGRDLRCARCSEAHVGMKRCNVGDGMERQFAKRRRKV